MKEKRKFQRIRCGSKCSLTHCNITYLGRLVNISMDGALIGFNEGLVIPNNEKCVLTIYSDELKTPLKSEVMVIHSNFTMVGIKFASEDVKVRKALDCLIHCLVTKEGDWDKETTLFYREREG